MNSREKSIYRGSCLCGRIKYQVDKIESQMGHCHCTMCRKFHGAAFATFGEAKKEKFRWLQGEDQLKSFVAENGTTRTFCNHCGSSLLFKASTGQDDIVEFSLGSLDSDLNVKPDAHIFIESKVNWIDLNDTLPKYLGDRDSD